MAASLAATALFQASTAAKAAGDLAASRVRASSSAARARASSDCAAAVRRGGLRCCCIGCGGALGVALVAPWAGDG